MSRLACVIWCLLPLIAEAQNCYTDSMPESTPGTQFVIHGDGTVTDVTTGLMWKQCPEGQSDVDCSIGEALLFSWDLALQAAGELNTSGGYANYDDWRLPSVAEMLTLVEEQCNSPAINMTVFPETNSTFFWSASPHVENDSATWFVDFHVGSSGNVARTSSYPVRLVRSIQ